MSLPRVSPTNPSPLPERDEAMRMNAICGLQPSSAFAWYDQDTSCWRTFQVSLLTNTCDEFTATWPKAGIQRLGVAYLRRKWEHPIRESDGSLLPTPTASSATTHDTDCQRFDCLTAWMHRQYGIGKVNPRSWEWIMMYPIGWTDLRPLEMDKFHFAQQQHGNSFHGWKQKMLEGLV